MAVPFINGLGKHRGTIRVLQSFPQPRETTNPYIVMLKESLERTPDLEVMTFSWRNALFGSYDVFHAHWPEILVNGASPFKKLVRQVLTALFLARLKINGTPIVRTLHNLERPTGISRRENLALGVFEKMTDLYILINLVGEAPDGKDSVRILHGHYRDWYGKYSHPAMVPGRISYFGLIRRYKGVEDLISAFRGLDDESASLGIAGRPSTAEQAEEIESAAGEDPRISTLLRFLSDEELVKTACEGQVVVLPYRHMHNSGTALAALSLDRPVLVPDNEANRALAEEVGPGWVHTFKEGLDTERLKEVLEVTSDPKGRSAQPNLASREWDSCGRAHRDAYRGLISKLFGKN